MHETSCALLTAVLAAAAKFFHGPEVYRSLLDHAQTLINRAVAEGSCEIGMVQCLMVLSHFKATRDRTAWIKIGMALRFAYQLGLHKALQDEVPADEGLARSQLVCDPRGRANNRTSSGRGSAFVALTAREQLRTNSG